MKEIIFYSPSLNRLYVFNMVVCRDIKLQTESVNSWAGYGLYYIGEL